MTPPTNFKQLVDIFIDLIKTALPVLVALAFLIFLWGGARFIFRLGGDEKAVEEGKNLMKWGLVALFVLVSFWSILGFFYRDIGFGNLIGLPSLP
jgi:hypothetical protein